VNYDWNFSRLYPYWEAFLSGTITTLSLTAAVLVIGTVVGLVLGLTLTYRGSRMLLFPLIDVIRAIPPLVLLLFMYYLLTEQVIGTTVQAFWVYVLAMSLNLAAFTSDVIRAAFTNVPRSAIEAGLSLGMSERQLIRHIVLPHVLRQSIPGMTILYIGMLKLSSLAAIINVREVVFSAQTVIADISRSLEAWSIVAAIYVVLVLPCTFAARWIESRSLERLNP
jgi:polar amino acid transport system permease protein